MLNIIILEDEAVSAQMVARIVTENAGTARIAAKVKDAWQLLIEEPADLVVVDTNLEGEWGWDFVERVRRSVVYSEVPVVVYSAVWRRDIVRRYMGFGVQAMLVKPYAPDRLMQEINKAAEMQWREPFFAFAAVPPPTGDEAEKFTALFRLNASGPDIVELAQRLASNYGDIAGQERMNSLAVRARAAGFNLLAEIAEKFANAAIQARTAHLDPLLDDVRAAVGILARVMQPFADYTPPPPESAPVRVVPAIAEAPVATHR